MRDASPPRSLYNLSTGQRYHRMEDQKPLSVLALKQKFPKARRLKAIVKRENVYNLGEVLTVE